MLPFFPCGAQKSSSPRFKSKECFYLGCEELGYDYDYGFKRKNQNSFATLISLVLSTKIRRVLMKKNQNTSFF